MTWGCQRHAYLNGTFKSTEPLNENRPALPQVLAFFVVPQPNYAVRFNELFIPGRLEIQRRKGKCPLLRFRVSGESFQLENTGPR